MPITPVHAAAIARLHEQLDGRAVDAAAGDYGCLDGRFELLGPHERIIGGMSRTPPPPYVCPMAGTVRCTDRPPSLPLPLPAIIL